MKQWEVLHDKSYRKGLLKRLGVVMGIIAIFVAIIQVILYATRPQVRYSLVKADCSSSSITARNKITGGAQKNCVLTINATNLKNEQASVDWNGVGGGPFAGWNPMIRINTVNEMFCYAGVSNPDNLEPQESRNLDLQCSGSSEKLPENYNEQSDENPLSIIISGYFDTVTLVVNPVKQTTPNLRLR